MGRLCVPATFEQRLIVSHSFQNTRCPPGHPKLVLEPPESLDRLVQVRKFADGDRQQATTDEEIEKRDLIFIRGSGLPGSCLLYTSDAADE